MELREEEKGGNWGKLGEIGREKNVYILIDTIGTVANSWE
jgi:hypothetical protein